MNCVLVVEVIKLDSVYSLKDSYRLSAAPRKQEKNHYSTGTHLYPVTTQRRPLQDKTATFLYLRVSITVAPFICRSSPASGNHFHSAGLQSSGQFTHLQSVHLQAAGNAFGAPGSGLGLGAGAGLAAFWSEA